MKNGMFWSEIGSGFGEPGGTPTTNSQEYPFQASILYFSDLCHNCQHMLSGLCDDKIKMYNIVHKESVKSNNFSLF